MRLIHYGSLNYDPTKVLPIKNETFVKPRGGLWTSPVDSDWGWIDWCIAEDWGSKRSDDFFILELISEKIFKIDSYTDLLNAPKAILPNAYQKLSRYFQNKFIDYELLAVSYDAIWLTRQGCYATHLSHPLNLYGWDCESVLIMNPKSVFQVETILK